jgi:hypothetical protein
MHLKKNTKNPSQLKIAKQLQRNLSVLSLLILLKSTVCQVHLNAQQNRTELSAGYNMLIYQSVYGMKNTFGAELAVGRQFHDQFKAQAGLRLGINPVRPEFFVRLNASQHFGVWTPTIGFETGISNRMYFESDTELLKETREAMLDDLGYGYLSSHTELLAFTFKSQWKISALETDFGTHFQNFGRTLRFQLTLLRIGRTF